jgi:SAM-dependent methyltransferase
MRRVVSAITNLFVYIFCIGFKRKYPFVRHAMYISIENIGKRLEKKNSDVLSISHSTHLIEMLGIKADTVTEANYPEKNILNLPYSDNNFDFILSDQVFEHIEGNPQQAIDESFRVLKPGGVLLHTTCFVLAYHGPGDFWRYSPEGLSYLCRKSSEIIESSGWGHPFVYFFTFLGLVHTKVPLSRWHPFNWVATFRRPSYDYMVWIAAKK